MRKGSYECVPCAGFDACQYLGGHPNEAQQRKRHRVESAPPKGPTQKELDQQRRRELKNALNVFSLASPDKENSKDKFQSDLEQLTDKLEAEVQSDKY